jgi:AcrR family transcriptional regulator
MSTSARILDAATRLCREEGAAAVTTDTLARAVGVSKRALYEHFNSRDDILEAVIMARLDRLESDLLAIEAAPGSIGTRIQRYAAVVAVVPSDFSPGFWPQLQRTAPTVAERVSQRRITLAREALTRLYAAGVASGDVRSDLAIPLLVAVTETLSEHLLHTDVPDGHTPLELAQAAVGVLLQGVLARVSA